MTHTTNTRLASTGPLPLVTEPPAPAQPDKRAAIGAGVGTAGVLIYLIDRLLADNGQLAVTMFERLGPILGPVWVSGPLLLFLSGWAGAARRWWRKAQEDRAAEAAARAAEAEAAAEAARASTAKLTDVAAGVDGLRLDLARHADAIDARLRKHEDGLAEVRAEVTQVRGRVDVLEKPRRRARG